MLTLTRFPGGVATKHVLYPKRRSCTRKRAVRCSAALRFRLRLLPPTGPVVPRRLPSGFRTPPRIAILCQVGRSDHFFYKPHGAGDDEPFTKDELELAEAIEGLEPYDRSTMLQHVSVEAMDAIQKTASGMLGMLPPSQFQVNKLNMACPSEGWL